MQRVRFLVRDRKRLFYSFCKNRKISLKTLSKELGVKYSSFKQYARGLYLIPFNLAKRICLVNSIDIKSLKIATYPGNWGASKGGKIGIKSLMNNYRDELYEWRKKGGEKIYRSNFGKRCALKRIKKPKISENLAEFVGIFLGDGTLTRDFIRIFGDVRYDKKYFEYISNLVNNLFGIKPKISESRNLLIMTISSRELTSYLSKELSLKFGDKIRNNSKVPGSILNESKLLKACIRGLVDTDGCIARSGTNLKLAFTAHNETLLRQLNKVNKKLKIFNRLYGNNLETCSFKKIKLYINTVGSSNLRNIIRFNERVKSGKLLYKGETLKYYPQYKNIKIPFYGLVV